MLGDSAVLGPEGGSGDFPAAITIATTPNDGANNVSGVVVGASDGNGAGGVPNVVGGEGSGGGGVENSGDDERAGRVEEGDRSFGGNRWPRQETLALLKIRSDMDLAFRDASSKGPLWEEVSRKLAELGYQRNAKKCKEKFENVFKYHKRTKEGRSGKSEGKTYRFFDQLQAFENSPTMHGIRINSPTPTAPSSRPLQATPLSMVVTTTTSSMPLPPVSNNTTVPSTTTLPIAQGSLNITPPSTLNTIPSSYPSSNPPTYFPTQTPNPTGGNNNNNALNTITPFSFSSIPADLLSNLSSSSTSSEETTTMEGGATTGKRKRKWKDFFESIMKEFLEKQEELQRRLLETMERREQERRAREDAWRLQEMQRINRERELLAQERSIAFEKDNAVLSMLNKIKNGQEEINLEPELNNNNNSNITIAPKRSVSQATATATPISTSTAFHEGPQAQPLVPQPQQVVTNVETNRVDNNVDNLMVGGSSSRWPKEEIDALIDLRTTLETKYQDNAPKGPLWEEISALMKKMGYNRSAKRCKEKWENINKYYKKVKESSKKRPEDSKTCPYFHKLDALYKAKNKVVGQMNPENMVAPLMVQPEQQWPPRQVVVPPEVSMGDDQNDPKDEQHHKEDNDKEMKDENENEGKEGGDSHEVVASEPTLA